jgi:hypothetical protein
LEAGRAVDADLGAVWEAGDLAAAVIWTDIADAGTNQPVALIDGTGVGAE